MPFHAWLPDAYPAAPAAISALLSGVVSKVVGLYVLARAGKIKEFTGISDPYESPENAEMVIDTTDISPDLAAHRILVKLESMGFIK